MASYTPNLNLYKKDPILDGNDFFNIKTMMNDNWDKIDESVKAALDDIGDLQSEQVRIATGSYVGTGTYGASNPCSLTFPFSPKVVFLSNDIAWAEDKRPGATSTIFAGGLPSIILMDIVPVEYNTYWRTVIINNTDSRYYSYVKKDLAGRSISWYNEDDPDGQQNYVNMTYHWMAIG